MEPIRVIKASRAVSLRELSRTLSTLIDEIERDGSLFILSRYGRMVAVLAPVPDRTLLEFGGSEWPEPDFELSTDRVEIREEWAKLDDAQRTVLRHAADDHPANLYISGVQLPVSPLNVAISRLELMGLLERVVGGWKATVDGLAAARWLDRAAAAPPS